MFISTIIVACLISGVAVGELHIGSCDFRWYYLEKNYCEASFVTSMMASNQPSSQCVSFSKTAHDCFKVKILDKCFTDEQEKEKKTLEFLETEFGGNDHFCKDGLLYSMAEVMENISPEDCQNPNYTDYHECEDSFKEVFHREFDGSGANATLLQKAFADAKICQGRVARSCRVPDTVETYHFYDVNEFNPYDPDIRETIDDAVDKMEKGESGGSQTVTIVTVVIVVLVVLAIAAGAFFYLHRRDVARADIRREKRESRKQQEKQQQQETKAGTEMQPFSSNTQDQDEISPA